MNSGREKSQDISNTEKIVFLKLHDIPEEDILITRDTSGE